MRRTPGFIRSMASLVDEVGRFGRERRVDGEVIDVRQHVADVFDARDAELGGLLGGEERIVAEDAHLKGEGPLGDFLADAAEADDAEGFVGELRAHEGFAVPLAFAELGSRLRRRGGRGRASA